MSGENVFHLVAQQTTTSENAATSVYTGNYKKHLKEPRKPVYSTFYEKNKEYDGSNVRFFKQREAVIGKNVGDSIHPNNFLKKGEGVQHIVSPIHEAKVMRKCKLDHGMKTDSDIFSGTRGQHRSAGDGSSYPIHDEAAADTSAHEGHWDSADGQGLVCSGMRLGGSMGRCGMYDDKKNFVATNIVEVSNMVPKRRKDQPKFATDRNDFGKVPSYLNRVKGLVNGEKLLLQAMDECRAARQQQAYAAYVFRLSDAERRDLINKLKVKLSTKSAIYNKMPFSKDTLATAKRKAVLEKSLADIESALKKLDKEAIFIYKDDPVNGHLTKNAALEDAKKRWVPCVIGRHMTVSPEQTLKQLQKDVSMIRAKIQTLEESKAANALVEFYHSRKTKKLDIKEGIRIFSQDSYHSPIFCHGHLPVILAHFIVGLDRLPDGLNAMPSILAVRETLLASFKKLVECELPISDAQIKHFRDVLAEIEDAHAERDLLQTVAVGILELKENLSRHRKALVQLKTSENKWATIDLTDADILPYEQLADIQEPLNFCNQCMITYNFLSRMFLNLERTDDTKVGMVDLEINLERVVRNAVDEAKQICIDYYGDCPDTEFVIPTDMKTFRFPYMSTTIRYVVLELMKNAFRATVEAHMKRNSSGIVTCDDMPPVHVVIHLKENIRHACVIIADEGNGMTKKALEMAMAYSYTSVSKPALALETEDDDGQPVEPSALAGYGYGLPMSRVYAQAFDGDLVLHSMEGYGTRAYYYIKLV